MKVKQIREKALLTQQEFAKEIGVSIATVQSWEQKNITPSFKFKRKIIDFCKEKKIKYEE